VLAVIIVSVSFVLITAQYGWEFDAVLSGSMEPNISVGGLVVIKPINAQHVNVGDVISFKLPGIDTPICHRVIDKQDTVNGLMFRTKGDANEEADQDLVPAASVKGKEVFYLPYIGRLASLSQLGRERVYLLGRGVPVAVLLVLPLGLAFIGLTFKDALEDIINPGKKRRKEALRIRRERFLKKRKAIYR
jgi:signal peptidase I